MLNIENFRARTLNIEFLRKRILNIDPSVMISIFGVVTSASLSHLSLSNKKWEEPFKKSCD